MSENIRVTIGDKEREYAKGTKVETVLESLLPAGEASRVLGVMRGGECLERKESLEESCILVPLTYMDDEGRRIAERSLRFLFLAAMKRLYPEKQVRILNSVGYGLYARAKDDSLSQKQIQAVEAEMLRLKAEDLPFEKEQWTREEAVSYFDRQGRMDKAELLRYRPSKTIAMYRMGGLCEYFYGAMLPSTGWVMPFRLKPHFPGVVLMSPAPDAPDAPAPYQPHAKFLRVFGQSQEWCNILGAGNAVDINRMLTEGRMREFIRVNEALHDKSIAAIADEIVERNARIIMIFGPSSSGKTTFANRLAVHLRVHGKRPRLLSLDDFYLNRDDLPLEADGTPDLEHVEALDLPLLSRCLEGLLGGEEVEMPRYDFTVARRSPQGVRMRITPEEPLLVEGIHGMNDRITSALPEQLMYGVYVSALTCINLDDHNRIRTTDVRLLRRIVRDVRMRNTSPRQTIAMWPKVRSGEEKWIFPYQEKADALFNTSLHYELPILKSVAYELLLSITKDEPEYLMAHRLLKTLHYFLPADGKVMNEIPPLSILREFVGECSFYDNH
ncbi:MAG: nucleoside kinase [Clostridiales bacterium]|nr:nucleoside kinase [Clostridiales bacterium]